MDISSAREVDNSSSPGDTEASGREEKARLTGAKYAGELKTNRATWDPSAEIPWPPRRITRSISHEKKRQMDTDSQYEGNASEVGARGDSAGDISDGIKRRDDVAAGDGGSQAGWTAESPTRTSGKNDVTTKPAATSTASTAEPQEGDITEGKLDLVRQFDEKPAVFSLHDAGVRLNVAQSCLGHGEVAGPITVLIDKIHLIECDGQTFLSSVVVDCQPSGKRFPIPLALDFRVGEPFDEDSKDDDSDCASEEDMGRELDHDQLQEYMKNLRDEYKVLVREKEGDAWSVLEDEKTRVLYEEGMFFVRASIEHFSQGCLAKTVNLNNPSHEEVVNWPFRPGKKQIEFVNATDRALTFLVLPTSWSNSAIQEIAGSMSAQGVTMDVAIKRAVEQSILPEATDPQVFQVPALKQEEPLRAGQMCLYRTCRLPKKTGSEARVILITVDGPTVEGPTVSVWDSRIVAHRTRVSILPGQFSNEMMPTLGKHRYDDLATGGMSVMDIALLAMSRGLQRRANRASVSTIAPDASTMALEPGHDE